MHVHFQRLILIVKMATMLEGCITVEQHIVGSFLWAKGLNAIDIHIEMFPVYGGKCLSHREVHNWVERLPPWQQIFH
jgi:starvation-inducible outer membrane lipoprotein